MLINKGVEVLVVGAGPAGLCTALSLVRGGVKVALVDEAPRIAGRSYACALHPGTVELLDEAGLAAELVARGRPLEAVAFYEGAERRARAEYSALQGKFPFLLVLPQRTLEDVLERALERAGVRVQWGHRVRAVTPEGADARVQLERLESASSGYSTQTTEWVAASEEAVRVRFVVGADGHRSRVRGELGAELQEAGAAQTFAVWEFAGPGPEIKEARVSIAKGRTTVLWPLGGGWWRLGFETDPLPGREARRRKSPEIPLPGDDSFVELDPSWLAQLARERAPWLEVEPRESSWSLALRFERRVTTSYGKGPIWLVGDAAHLSPPIGVQSLNAGLREGRSLAAEIAAVLRENALRARLDAWAAARRGEIAALLGTEAAAPSAEPFIRENARAIADALPVSGPGRKAMLASLGIEVPGR